MENRSKIRKALISKSKEIFLKSQQKFAEHDYAAPISPSPQAMIDNILSDLTLSEDDYIIDLGCGDGRWIIQAALLYNLKGEGFEIDKERISKFNENVLEKGVSSKVCVRDIDLFEADISMASVVIIYLFSGSLLEKLVKKLVNELNVSNTKSEFIQIVSIGFVLPFHSKIVHIKTYKVQGLSAYLYHF